MCVYERIGQRTDRAIINKWESRGHIDEECWNIGL